MTKRTWGVMACTEDLPATIQMYEEMFDTKAAPEWDGCVSFAFDGARLYVMQAPEMAPFLVSEVNDIEAEVARLRGLGFEAVDPFEVRVGRFTFYQDHRGNQFGLLQPA